MVRRGECSDVPKGDIAPVLRQTELDRASRNYMAVRRLPPVGLLSRNHKREKKNES